MSLINSFRIQPTYSNFGSNENLSSPLDTSSKKYAYAFIPSESMVLNKVAFRLLSITGTPVAYNIRIETDDGAGRPSGALAWTNATAQVTPTASGWITETALTATGTINVGTIYHMVIQANVDPTSNYISVQENAIMPAGGSGGNLTYQTARYDGASWTTRSSGVFVLVSNATIPIRMGQVIHAGGVYTITNTVWYGMKIIAPVTATLWGCGIGKLNSTSAGIVSAKLINSSNTVLSTASIPAGWWDLNTGRDNSDLFIFDIPTVLAAGETYRIVWKDTTGNQRIEYHECASTYQDIKPGGPDYIYTTGTSSDGTASPTSWTDIAYREGQGFYLNFYVAPPTQLDDDSANDVLTQLQTTFPAGSIIDIYDALAPASPNSAHTGNILVSTTLPATPWGTPASGVMAKSGTWSATASATGIPMSARLRNSGDTKCMDFSCTGSDGTGQVKTDTTNIVGITSGATVTISSFTITA